MSRSPHTLVVTRAPAAPRRRTGHDAPTCPQALLYRAAVLDLEMELSNNGDDWVERAVRDLSVTELVRCEQDVVFATFGFPDFQYPEQPGSH